MVVDQHTLPSTVNLRSLAFPDANNRPARTTLRLSPSPRRPKRCTDLRRLSDIYEFDEPVSTGSQVTSPPLTVQTEPLIHSTYDTPLCAERDVSVHQCTSEPNLPTSSFNLRRLSRPLKRHPQSRAVPQSRGDVDPSPCRHSVPVRMECADCPPGRVKNKDLVLAQGPLLMPEDSQSSASTCATPSGASSASSSSLTLLPMAPSMSLSNNTSAINITIVSRCSGVHSPSGCAELDEVLSDGETDRHHYGEHGKEMQKHRASLCNDDGMPSLMRRGPLRKVGKTNSTITMLDEVSILKLPRVNLRSRSTPSKCSRSSYCSSLSNGSNSGNPGRASDGEQFPPMPVVSLRELEENAKGQVPTFQIHVTLRGASKVGKTALWNRMKCSDVEDEHFVSVGNNFTVQDVRLCHNTIIRTRFGDTAGHVMFAAKNNRLMLQDAVVIVYGISDHSSFMRATEILDECKGNAREDTVFLICGNKLDRAPTRRAVRVEEGRALANSVGGLFAEVSARTNENVTETFLALIERTLCESKREKVRAAKWCPNEEGECESSERLGLASNSVARSHAKSPTLVKLLRLFGGRRSSSRKLL
eukprot:GEMP01027191.1.p1 GENE.GEMP01027191.1~~GEMP01027191.1.p1  ORF type:complete len:587 (+),score=100.43 GEMP01027191.1:30-1790(+)